MERMQKKVDIQTAEYKDDRQEHLALLVEKHKMELNLFYVRINLYLVFLAVLVTGIITTIASGTCKLSSHFLWGMVGGVALIAWIVSRGMVRVTQASSQWVNFWQAKISVFEANNPPPDDSWYFFLDRSLKDPEKALTNWAKERLKGRSDSTLTRSEVHPEKFREVVAQLSNVWNRTGLQGAQILDPIALRIVLFLKIISVFWLLLFLSAFILAAFRVRIPTYCAGLLDC